MINVLLPTLISILTTATFVLMGERSRSGPYFGLVTQLLWALYIGQTRAWGFIPMTLFFSAIFLVGVFTWYPTKTNVEEESNE